jgi:hypothetical protein
MLANERLQLGHDLPFARAAEVGLEPVLEDAQPHLLEPLRLTPERVGGESC